MDCCGKDFDYSWGGTKSIPANVAPEESLKVDLPTDFSETGYIDNLSGCPIVARREYVDGVLVEPLPLGYIDDSGQFVVSDQANIIKPPAPLTQMTGDYQFEVYAETGDVTLTAADIINRAVSDSVPLWDSQGGQSSITSGAFISSIDIDLKPIGGLYGDLTETGTSDASEAVVMVSGGSKKINPGGSITSTAGLIDGYLVPSNFESVEIKAQSVVEISVIFATVPQ